MRWTLIVGGLVVTLVLVVAVVALIGAMLPQAHVAARQVRFTQTPERVFAVISDFAQTPAWRKTVTRVEMLPPQDGHVMFREHGQDPVTYRVETIEPPRRMVVRIADTNLPYGGAWIYDVTPTGTGGAQLTITERGEVYNPIFRFVSRYVMSHHATIDTYLGALGEKLGEPVTPEPAPAAPASASAPAAASSAP
jgi:uncharacterized protein YndB with AHSA1/START domain